MRIYSLRLTYMIILGIPFIHLLDLGLCAFFVKKFLVETYDPGVYLLLALLGGSMLIADILGYPLQLYQRCFLKFKMNEIGIRCYGFCMKSWVIPWEEVRTYGFSCYRKMGESCNTVFFSMVPNEEYRAKQHIRISRQRIVIQVRGKVIQEFEQHLPRDMKKKLLYAITKGEECYCRR